MALALAMTQAFGKYQRGDTITDPAEIEAIRDKHEESFVRKVMLPDQPKAEPEK